MMHLLLAANNAGRPLDCLHWADEAISLGATGRLSRTAHRMAGLACGQLGRLEESEGHYRQAYEVAAAENDTPDKAEILGSLASCLLKRGKLVEANETCIKAATMDPKAVRMSLAVQSEILLEWGRYDEALAVISRSATAAQSVIPTLDRRYRAVCALEISRIEAQCGRASDAWRHIQEAIAVLGNDAKLGLKCEAAASWVLAARGLADESQHRATQLEPRLAAFERDPSTGRGVLYDLGMAACTRGDYHAGITCWTRYLALSPDPVYRPTAHYRRGECHRHLGQLTEARNDYDAAVAMNLDTHHTKLARRRLMELAIF
jgi:tetratricopeptide (TPR) repeat protein